MPDKPTRRAHGLALLGLVTVLLGLGISLRVVLRADAERARVRQRVDWLGQLQRPASGPGGAAARVETLRQVAACADCSGATRDAAAAGLAHPVDAAAVSSALREENAELSRSLGDAWQTLEYTVFGAGFLAIAAYLLVVQLIRRARVAAATRQRLQEEAAARAAADQQLQREQAFTEGLFATAPFGIAVFDVSGLLLRMNEAQARMAGLPSVDVAVGKYNALTDPFAKSSGSALTFARAAAGEVVRVPGRRVNLDAPTNSWATRKCVMALDQVYFPLRDASGRVTTVVQANHDVTEIYEQRERLMAAERLAAVGTLAAGVAHEINNPLAYISSNLSWLEAVLSERRADLPAALWPQLEESLRDGRDGVARVQSIVRDLGTLSSPRREEVGRVRLVDALAPALRILDHEVRYRATIVDRVDPERVVRANPQALGQVLLNLIQNAAHAIAPGAPTQHRITFTTTALPGERVRLSVADTGPGIPPEQAPHIFEPFFTTKPVGQGTGLGLSVCRGLVDRMGGELSFETAVGKGSVFHVDLPLATLAERPADGPAVVAPDRRLRLLVVDDEPLFARAIRRQLREVADVTALTSGSDALALIRQDDSWDGLLLDIMMPEMDGPTVLDALQQLAPALTRRVILMSGGAFSPRGTALWASFKGPRLSKPFEASALITALRTVSDLDRT